LKLPFTSKIFLAPPSSNVLGNQVTMDGWKNDEIEESLKIIHF
jgi:hypothetical protein